MPVLAASLLLMNSSLDWEYFARLYVSPKTGASTAVSTAWLKTRPYERLASWCVVRAVKVRKNTNEGDSRRLHGRQVCVLMLVSFPHDHLLLLEDDDDRGLGGSFELERKLASRVRGGGRLTVQRHVDGVGGLLVYVCRKVWIGVLTVQRRNADWVVVRYYWKMVM